MTQVMQIEWAGRPLSISFGEVARQADGAVLLRYADTVVVVTAVASKRPEAFLDFFPLTVEYQEMSYAAGRIPGGFFKREGRPSDKEILTSRLIDRPIRPLFPEGFLREIQIIATVLSVDQENEPDILAVIGASSALGISDIPFNGPIAAVRVGRNDGQWIINPTYSQLEKSDINLVVAGHEKGIVMVEGGGHFVPEEDILEAIFVGHEALKPVLELQKQLMAIGNPKIEVIPPPVDSELVKRMADFTTPLMQEALTIPKKQLRYGRLEEIFSKVVSDLDLTEEKIPEAQTIFKDLEKKAIRQMVLEGRRIDGRSVSEIRPVICEVGVLPRTHGSAIFRRGETQILAVTTLGTSENEQKIESLYGESFKSFMVHYNFPPYCVGETRKLRGPGRREIGHGALVERTLKSLIPSEEEFPYTIRVVSEVLESNGSSSMATVCGGCMSLMDAGVPIKKHVAGIGMGLILEPEKTIILSDITGDEDHCGDMDFKIAGTEDGITAFQMDVKIEGVKREILQQALNQSKEARLYILEKMAEAIPGSRPSISPYAPKVTIVDITPEKIASLIGPGGKVIKNIISETGVSIDIKETGKVHIVSYDEQASQKAMELVKQATQEVEVGRLYIGKVKKIVDFGALVEISPGIVGLVHISELDRHHVKKVTDVAKEGDEVLVRVLGIERDGKIRLSRKAALSPPVHKRETRR